VGLASYFKGIWSRMHYGSIRIRLFQRCLLALSSAIILLCATAQNGEAHPLGNFTINHLTEANFSAQRVTVRYIVDMAEIPTYQAMRSASPNAHLTTLELQALANAQATANLNDVVVTVAGLRVPLRLDQTMVATRPGAGGLPTLYIVASASGNYAASTTLREVRVQDTSFAGRLGWRDIVIAPQTEPTHELRKYPADLLASPRTIADEHGTMMADGHVTGIVSSTIVPEAETANGRSSLMRSNQLSDMIARGTDNIPFVGLTLLIAIVLGALHALEPGHGKTLLAISLVGARATVPQAAILAGALTVAHTMGVIALGIALNVLKGYFVPENVYPWITLLSGILIAVIGARAIAPEIRKRLGDYALVTHAHGGSTHSHASSGPLSEEEHARMHMIPGTAPLKFGATVWAAASGGIAPCPAALVVLLAATALHQIAYGIIVIVAFSFGLAATLTGIGIAVVRSAVWLRERPYFERVTHFSPIVSALVISIIGAIMVGQGVHAQSTTVPWILVSALVLVAIAGYGFSLPHDHKSLEISS
jgi:nickel/cobalt exporter